MLKLIGPGVNVEPSTEPHKCKYYSGIDQGEVDLSTLENYAVRLWRKAARYYLYHNNLHKFTLLLDILKSTNFSIDIDSHLKNISLKDSHKHVTLIGSVEKLWPIIYYKLDDSLIHTYLCNLIECCANF